MWLKNDSTSHQKKVIKIIRYTLISVSNLLLYVGSSKLRKATAAAGVSGDHSRTLSELHAP